ncbi:MAG: hypothetical protein Q9220_002990 [cf. Caloplaca sp. 1 TL-2023]
MNTTSRPAHQTPSKLDETDKRLQQINDTILPDAPYLMDLIAPSGYRLPPHQMNDWRRSCPFDKYEEQLQYMTFLPHTARGDTMLRTVGNWDDGEGKTKNEAAKMMSGNSSRSHSPSAGQLPKKKISLAGYINKKGGQSSGRTSPKAGIDGKSSNRQPESVIRSVVKEWASTEAPNVVQHTVQKQESRPSESTLGRKRSADAMAESQDAQIFDAPQASPPAKKVHTTSRVTGESSVAPTANGNVHGLPRMLSPTLPASVEEQLAKLRGGDLPPLKKTTATTPMAASKRPRDSNHAAAVKAVPKSIAQHKHTVSWGGDTNLQTNQPAHPQDPHSTNISRTAKEPKSSVTTNAKDGVESKTRMTGMPNNAANGLKPNGQIEGSGEMPIKVDRDDARPLIVVLKISKRLRRDCKRILQLKPHRMRIPGQEVMTQSHSRNPSKESPTIKATHDHQTKQERAMNGVDKHREDDTKNKPKAVANGVNNIKPSEKRQQTSEALDSLQPPRKRQKPSDIDPSKPQTPIAAALRSPSIFHPISAHKSQLSTPKSTLKSSAMSRIGSAEGDVMTPLGSVKGSTPTAPNSAERPGSNRPTSTGSVASSSTAGPLFNNTNGDTTFYRAEFNKYADMAKSLKRAADTLAKLPGGQINTDTVARRQGLALAIETTLCYMLAFTLKDEPARIRKVAGDRTAWLSLLPYFKFLKSVTQETESSHLQGLFYQLEAVCRDTIFDYDTDRLEHEVINGNEEQQAEFSTFKKSMAENARLAKSAWYAGTRMLTVDDFEEKFPRTWNDRSKSFLDSRGRENLVPGKYGEGGFYLPLSGSSSRIEAVRAGWSVLEEWTAKEGVQWEGKMGL